MCEDKNHKPNNIVYASMSMRNNNKEKRNYWSVCDTDDTTGMCDYCGLMRKTKWIFVEEESCYKCFMKMNVYYEYDDFEEGKDV